MRKGILGEKLGMMQLFTETGEAKAVTVVQAGPCVVVSVKTPEKDGYKAVQLGFQPLPEKRATKPYAGQFKKIGIAPQRFLREVRDMDIEAYQPGQEIRVGDLFTAGERVDVIGTSKGKGFQGVIKRFHGRRGPMSHGSMYHRRPGSMGATGPNRVLKGKPLPGHMGAQRVTVQNLEVVRVDADRNLLFIAGGLPGPQKGLLLIQDAVKSAANAKGGV